MKKSKIVTTVLILSGVLMIIPGLMSLFAPEAFTSRNGIDIGGNLGLYNDYRGLGGILLGCGLSILLGAFRPNMAFTSTVVAAVVYSSFGLGRLVSIAMDGIPVKGMVAATVVECLIGVLAIWLLSRYRQPIQAA